MCYSFIDDNVLNRKYLFSDNLVGISISFHDMSLETETVTPTVTWSNLFGKIYLFYLQRK